MSLFACEFVSASVRSAMAEFSGDVGMEATVVTPTPLNVSGSFKEGKKPSLRRPHSMRPSLDADEFMNLLHGSDPVKLELNRLENEVKGVIMWFDLACFWIDFRFVIVEFDCGVFSLSLSVADKDRELSEALVEIKALKHSERLREKAVEEVCLWFSVSLYSINFEFP